MDSMLDLFQSSGTFESLVDEKISEESINKGSDKTPISPKEFKSKYKKVFKNGLLKVLKTFKEECEKEGLTDGVFFLDQKEVYKDYHEVSSFDIDKIIDSSKEGKFYQVKLAHATKESVKDLVGEKEKPKDVFWKIQKIFFESFKKHKNAHIEIFFFIPDNGSEAGFMIQCAHPVTTEEKEDSSVSNESVSGVLAASSVIVTLSLAIIAVVFAIKRGKEAQQIYDRNREYFDNKAKDLLKEVERAIEFINATLPNVMFKKASKSRNIPYGVSADDFKNVANIKSDAAMDKMVMAVKDGIHYARKTSVLKGAAEIGFINCKEIYGSVVRDLELRHHHGRITEDDLEIEKSSVKNVIYSVAESSLGEVVRQILMKKKFKYIQDITLSSPLIHSGDQFHLPLTISFSMYVSSKEADLSLESKIANDDLDDLEDESEEISQEMVNSNFSSFLGTPPGSPMKTVNIEDIEEEDDDASM